MDANKKEFRPGELNIVLRTISSDDWIHLQDLLEAKKMTLTEYVNANGSYYLEKWFLKGETISLAISYASLKGLTFAQWVVDGKSLDYIAIHANIPRERIRQLIYRETNITVPELINFRESSIKDEVYRLHACGLTPKDIALIMGFKPSKIKRYIKLMLVNGYTLTSRPLYEVGSFVKIKRTGEVFRIIDRQWNPAIASHAMKVRSDGSTDVSPVIIDAYWSYKLDNGKPYRYIENVLEKVKEHVAN